MYKIQQINFFQEAWRLLMNMKWRGLLENHIKVQVLRNYAFSLTPNVKITGLPRVLQQNHHILQLQHVTLSHLTWIKILGYLNISFFTLLTANNWGFVSPWSSKRQLQISENIFFDEAKRKDHRWLYKGAVFKSGSYLSWDKPSHHNF